MIRSGRAWAFPGGLSAEDLLPRQYSACGEEELAAHVLRGRAPGLIGKIGAGDFIVAGGEVGRGEHAARAAVALWRAGIGGVIAPSFFQPFFRVCINLGLPPLTVWEAGEIRNGDRLRVDLAARVVKSFSSGSRCPVRGLADVHAEVLACGGMDQYVRAVLGGGRGRREPAT